MRLPGGTRLGPYQLSTLLGEGGMGVVYRARDERLRRDVAVKVLHAPIAADRRRVRRFELEAYAAGALSHPNVLSIYDIGTHEGAPYVVSELLEGETLRQRLRRGTPAVGEAVSCALQVARGLAAAHAKGIVHRDLKPENLFLTEGGGVKLLDFGIAKLSAPDEGAPGGPTEAADTVSLGTEPGTILGTVGYMSPEQVRGQPAGPPSDIFALGAILYEMLSGAPAFGGESGVERMHATLRDRPPELASVDPRLAQIVARCLEKAPADRFGSARDVADALEAWQQGEAPAAPPEPLEPAPAARRGGRLTPLAIAALVALPAGAFVLGRRTAPGGEPAPPARASAAAASASGRGALPLYRQLTFQSGSVHSARFAADGRTVVYSAAWGGEAVRLYTVRTDSGASRPLGLPSADILSISDAGQMALSLDRAFFWWPGEGTLARAPLLGDSARAVLEGVQDAAFGPDGESLAVARRAGGRFRLEYPPEHSLYETKGSISHPRFSRDGTKIGFFEHPFSRDDQASVVVVDLAGHATTLSTGWLSGHGLAWSPEGELWFSAASNESAGALYAIDRGGAQRVVARVPGRLALQDITPDGRVLASHDAQRTVVLGVLAGGGEERDLSWLGLSLATDISRDGRALLLSEQSSAGRTPYDIFLRTVDGAFPVRLGEGLATGLSPDGKWVLNVTFEGFGRLSLLPTGPGESRPVSGEGFNVVSASWFPDGTRLLVWGDERGRGRRFYEQRLAGGAPRPITPEGDFLKGVVSPDGRQIACQDAHQALWVFPVSGGEGRAVATLGRADDLSGWAGDGRSVYVLRRGVRPGAVDRLEIATGRRERWKELSPADPTGLVEVSKFVVVPDGTSYAYTFYRKLSTLYLIEGLR